MYNWDRNWNRKWRIAGKPPGNPLNPFKRLQLCSLTLSPNLQSSLFSSVSPLCSSLFSHNSPSHLSPLFIETNKTRLVLKLGLQALCTVSSQYFKQQWELVLRDLPESYLIIPLKTFIPSVAITVSSSHLSFF